MDESDGRSGVDGGFEPDYRFTLANERTFLAWQRTSLGLLAAGVAVVQLAPEFAVPGARYAIGALLAALATVTVGGGVHRWRQVDRAIRLGAPLPRHTVLPWVGAALTLVAAFVVVLVALRAGGR